MVESTDQNSDPELQAHENKIQDLLRPLAKDVDFGSESTTPDPTWVESFAMQITSLCENITPTSRGEISVTELVQTFASDLAWNCRERHLTPTYARDMREIALIDPRCAYAAAVLELSRYRYDFDFQLGYERIGLWKSLLPADTFIDCLESFFLLGLRREESISRATALVPVANAAGLYALLQGAWLGTTLPGQAELILNTAQEIERRGRIGANLYYWKSAGLRLQERFSEALSSIDLAIHLLPSHEIVIHQDYVRERELVANAIQFEATITRMRREIKLSEEALITATREEIDRETKLQRRQIEDDGIKTRDAISGSLAGVVEIVGLFVALITFVAGSMVTVFQQLTFGRMIATLVIISVGSSAFLATLKLIIRVPGFMKARPRRRSRESSSSATQPSTGNLDR